MYIALIGTRVILGINSNKIEPYLINCYQLKYTINNAKN